jgi:hypothetical protein
MNEEHQKLFNVSVCPESLNLQYTPNIMAIIQYFDDVSKHKLPEYREISLDYTIKGKQGKERDEPASLFMEVSESGVSALFGIYQFPQNQTEALKLLKTIGVIERFVCGESDMNGIKNIEQEYS